MKNSSLPFYSAVFCVAFLFLAGCVYQHLSGGAYAQEAPPPNSPISVNSDFEWDAPTTNLDGSPLTDLQGYELAIFEVGHNPNTTAGAPSAFKATTGTSTPIKSMLGGIPAGPVSFWVSALDTSGNRSPWTGPVDVLVDPVGPSAPANLRLVVTAVVTIGE